MRNHFVIPDCQVTPEQDTSYLRWIGNYIAAKRPEVIVCLGDFNDMSSLCQYDEGTGRFEGRRYWKDIQAGKNALKKLMEPVGEYNEMRKAMKKGPYQPELIMCLGNHENRISRAVDKQPAILEGVISLDDLGYEQAGWKVVPFLDPIIIDGVCYVHYFETGNSTRAISTPRAILNKKHMSCVTGHQQGRQIASDYRGDGKRITSLICGSAYPDHMDWMSPQSNNHWRGCYMLYNVDEGEFNEVPVEISYLKKKYGAKGAWERA